MRVPARIGATTTGSSSGSGARPARQPGRGRGSGCRSWRRSPRATGGPCALTGRRSRLCCRCYMHAILILLLRGTDSLATVSSKLGHVDSSKSGAALARDAALARIVRTRRWVIAAAAALTAGIAALVSAVAPGHSLAAKSKTAPSGDVASASTSSSGSGIPRMPAPASAGDLGLQGPSQAPSPAPSPSPSPAPEQQQPQSIPSQPPSSDGGGGPVVSGGS